jgi:error-prone DNA polymerase
MEYAELHCHSSFSLLDGASNPEELIGTAQKLGLKALAITDHDDMGGIVRFSEAAKEASFEAILGAELTLEDDSHLTLLVENLDGYKNLCYLISRARLASVRGLPHVSYDELAQYAKGLVALSGCPHGAIPHNLLLEKVSEAERLSRFFQEIYEGRFFYELWDHGVLQEAVLCKGLVELSGRNGTPCLVTNNVHYASRRKRIVHDVLTCLKHEVILSTAGRRLRPNDNWCLKSPEEMFSLWQNYPDFLTNTVRVAERCQFRLFSLKPSLPHFPTPDNLTYDEFLERLVWKGAERLFETISPQHTKQIQHELDIIKRMQIAPYFLIMWDIVEFAKSKGILVQGRGSAANSVVCYCLAITAVDPVAMQLLFERFISEGRDEPPDIDLDIAHQHREIVLQYVYNKYGREHAGMVCETITYRGRSAVRDAARVLGFSQEQAEHLARQSHFSEAKDAAISLASGGVQEAGLDIKDNRTRTLIEVVAGLDRLPRHRSIHVGGFVLSGEPLGKLVPLEPASMKDRTVIQWDKDDLNPVGMFKIDLLGLGMLSMVQEASRLIKIHRQQDFEMAKLDMHDAGVFEMLQKADTIGIFQVESRAQMSILPKLYPQRFYDIVVSIALIRPGPIQGNIVHPYIRRRRGLEPVTYPHPSLIPVLERTLGVPLFQEQGMRVAVIAGGFTPAQADQLRRVMSFKRSKERMSDICMDLADGMKRNGFSDEVIISLTNQLQAFANYGFPESHSASFALIAYASAYLKRHFAPEFYCAMLNAQPLGFYSPNTLIRDALRHDVKVLPIDLARSDWDCTLEPIENNGTTKEQFAMRMGLRYIHSLGSKAKELLEKAWREGGPFRSAEDVCARSGLGWKTLQLLATAGAFETFIPGRRQALWEVIAISKRKDLPLLKELKKSESNDSTAHLNIPPMTEFERTVADYQTQLFSVFEHITKYYRPWAEKNGMKSCSYVMQGKNNEYITIAASVICRQRPGTAKDFVFLTLEDETGLANVVVNPKIFKQYKEQLLRSNFLAISGTLQVDEGVRNLIARQVESLPKLVGNPKFVSRDFH